MNAIDSHETSKQRLQESIINFYADRLRELVQIKGNLSRDDLEYTMEAVSRLDDERLKQCVATLIGWGDDERSELETFLAIAVELMKEASPDRLKDAATKVEIRFLQKGGV